MTLSVLKKSTLQVYSFGFFLVLGLFYLHTALIFNVAGSLLSAKPWFLEYLEPQEAGKMIVLGCFVILFFAHIVNAAIWGLFLRWSGLVPSFLEGFYFVGVTISTLGYGDVLLKKPWRHLGPMIAIAGVLKFGCSTAFLFFAIQTVWVSQI
ncbi:MAG: ion channel [Halothiobacillaceae bacterium]